MGVGLGLVEALATVLWWRTLREDMRGSRRVENVGWEQHGLGDLEDGDRRSQQSRRVLGLAF